MESTGTSGTRSEQPSAALRTAARVAVAAGVATLGLSVAFVLQPETRAALNACGESPPSLVQFQLALTGADVLTALGAEGACRDASIVAMDAANRLDLYAYIATYGAFLLLSLFAVMGEARVGRYQIVALVVVVALLADAIETALQLRMTQDLSTLDWQMPILIVAARLKYIGLSIAAVAASWAGWKTQPRRLVLAVSCLPLICLMPLALSVPKSFAELVPLTVAVAWLVLLGTALHIALRRQA